jgi:hypothetical protein
VVKECRIALGRPILGVGRPLGMLMTDFDVNCGHGALWGSQLRLSGSGALWSDLLGWSIDCARVGQDILGGWAS